MKLHHYLSPLLLSKTDTIDQSAHHELRLSYTIQIEKEYLKNSSTTHIYTLDRLIFSEAHYKSCNEIDKSCNEK